MISEQQIEAVGGWLQVNAGNTSIEQDLRAAFSDMHFTFCLDDDVISDAPAYALPGYKLYMVDSSSHCLCLTNDRECASGLVIAELDEE